VKVMGRDVLFDRDLVGLGLGTEIGWIWKWILDFLCF